MVGGTAQYTELKPLNLATNLFPQNLPVADAMHKTIRYLIRVEWR
jgi:hypothetical protein